MGDMLCTFYLWMLSKMTLHPQTPLSERRKKKTETTHILHAGQIRTRYGQAGVTIPSDKVIPVTFYTEDKESLI